MFVTEMCDGFGSKHPETPKDLTATRAHRSQCDLSDHLKGGFGKPISETENRSFVDILSDSRPLQRDAISLRERCNCAPGVSQPDGLSVSNANRGIATQKINQMAL